MIVVQLDCFFIVDLTIKQAIFVKHGHAKAEGSSEHKCDITL